MMIVVGLGNPGRRYAGTRHNVGHQVVQRIADSLGIRWEDAGWAKTARGRVKGATLLLATPVTYMNVSGQAVRDLLRRRRRHPEDALVVHDDMDLSLGRLRLRPGNGAGGHNGVQSIVEELGTGAFPRLRIGIGRPPAGVDPAEFVLQRFTAEEQPCIDDAVNRAAEAVIVAATQGLPAAMNRYNRRASDGTAEAP
jgi:peptidyl-tRNA hydrolase, PTH1 family